MYKILDEFPNYRVYDDGRIWSEYKNDFLIPYITPTGYYTVSLWNKMKHRTMKVHRLVATAFISNPNNLPEVNHKDENKGNNNVDNLEWCTNEYNINYGTRNKRIGRCIRCIELDKIYCSISQAERELKINRANICQACKKNNKTAGGYHWEYIDPGANLVPKMGQEHIDK